MIKYIKNSKSNLIAVPQLRQNSFSRSLALARRVDRKSVCEHLYRMCLNNKRKKPNAKKFEILQFVSLFYQQFHHVSRTVDNTANLFETAIGQRHPSPLENLCHYGEKIYFSNRQQPRYRGTIPYRLVGDQISQLDRLEPSIQSRRTSDRLDRSYLPRLSFQIPELKKIKSFPRFFQKQYIIVDSQL